MTTSSDVAAFAVWRCVTMASLMSLVDVKVGEYVLVHAGFAIQVVDRKEAEETIALFKEMLEMAGEA